MVYPGAFNAFASLGREGGLGPQIESDHPLNRRDYILYPALFVRVLHILPCL